MTEHIYETAREKWLDNHGGRTEGDVIRDKYGDFIVLWDGKAKVQVKKYVPDSLGISCVMTVEEKG